MPTISLYNTNSAQPSVSTASQSGTYAPITSTASHDTNHHHHPRLSIGSEPHVAPSTPIPPPTPSAVPVPTAMPLFTAENPENGTDPTELANPFPVATATVPTESRYEAVPAVTAVVVDHRPSHTRSADHQRASHSADHYHRPSHSADNNTRNTHYADHPHRRGSRGSDHHRTIDFEA